MRIVRTHKGLMKSLIKQFGQGGRLYTKQDLLQCRAKSNKSSASYKGNGAGDDHSERLKAAEEAMQACNDKYGANTLRKLGSNVLPYDANPTGILSLDIALGGGFPKGRIIEIYGPESSGKTTLALQAIAAVQKAGGLAALIDAEHAFDPTFAKQDFPLAVPALAEGVQHLTQRSGVDVDTLAVCQPDSGEMALDVCDHLVRSSGFAIVAIDSVAALTPKAEVEADIGQQTVGLQARMMSAGLRKINHHISKHNVTVIFINQLRQKIGVVYGNPEVTPGGNALKYYASMRLEVRRTKTIEGPNKEPTGIKVRTKVAKNKVAPPYRTCEFDIMFDSGISVLGSLVDAAESLGVVMRRGPWYSFGDEKIAQGREKTIQWLKENPEKAEIIEKLTREKLHEKNSLDEKASGNGAASPLDDDEFEKELEEDPDFADEQVA